jgi:sulfite exporter TauE/SafE
LDLLNNIDPAILVSALIFGAASSLHCFAMCGPLAFQAKDNPKRQISYQLGRLISYLLIGFLIHNIANSIFTELTQSLQSYALYLLMGIYLLIGLQMIFRKKNTLPTDSTFAKFYNSSFKLINRWQQKPFFSLSLGLISGLLPCGLLHTFLLGVIPLEKNLMVGLYILSFWIATTPALTISAYSFGYLKNRFKGQLSTLQGTTFLGISLYVLYIKHTAVLAGQCQ